MRVLLIGNVANNSFYAAKLLRRQGIWADVLEFETYHAMSSPEWEDADFDEPPPRLDRPEWWAMDLKGYQRPRWFAQGPILHAVAYLLARHRGSEAEIDARWAALEQARRAEMFGDPVETPAPQPAAVRAEPAWAHRARRWARRIEAGVTRRLPERPPPVPRFDQRVAELTAIFRERFPHRPDGLIAEDAGVFRSAVEPLRPLLAHYDVIHASATSPILPLLADVPFVAFEHGTLRDSPHVTGWFKGPHYPNAIGRLTALAYTLADYVFITNADCLSSACRLGLRHFAGVPHPFDDRAFQPPREAAEDLRRKLSLDHVILCPIRHDWEEKGVDRYLRALPALRARVPGRFRVFLTLWGAEISRSQSLIRSLGADDLVEWIQPMGRRRFVKWLGASDLVWDQLKYTSLSGLGPRTLAAGRPVIGAYAHEGLRWMFNEPAPIIAASTTMDVIERTVEALAPGFAEAFEPCARRWIARHHSGVVVTRALLEGYRFALSRRAGPPRRA